MGWIGDARRARVLSVFGWLLSNDDRSGAVCHCPLPIPHCPLHHCPLLPPAMAVRSAVLLAMVQINPTVGDLDANRARIEDAIARARGAGAELIVLSELCVCGYPPRDLLLVDGFVERCAAVCDGIGAAHTDGVTLVLGSPILRGDGSIANAALCYQDGVRVAAHEKRLLPTYDVFDEDRYFEPGHEPTVIEHGGVRIGLAICEDLWRADDAGFAARYAGEPDHLAQCVDRGAELIVVPSASPFVLGKIDAHRSIMRAHATRLSVPIAGVNQVGGNDDLVFAGRSCLIGASGAIHAAGRAFGEDLVVVDAFNASGGAADPVGDEDERQLAEALTLGVRDYVTKCGFSDVCIGLSGGIDSALVAAIAVRALGPERVLGVSMPGRFSSRGSVDDARALADALGIRLVSVPIEPAFEGFRGVLDEGFDAIGERALGASLPDLTQENLQSRIRGTIMMGVSNRTGALVLTTGNKSEIAVGYCTLYGDMNGGLAVIADLPKSAVFGVSRHLNAHAKELGYRAAPIPENTLTKPPSAELAPDQLDSDTLPEYGVLDEIVERHIERLQSAARITEETGLDPGEVRRVCALIDRNEYKRHQMAVGLKLTSIAFGRGRRMPIAQRWTR